MLSITAYALRLVAIAACSIADCLRAELLPTSRKDNRMKTADWKTRTCSRSDSWPGSRLGGMRLRRSYSLWLTRRSFRLDLLDS